MLPRLLSVSSTVTRNSRRVVRSFGTSVDKKEGGAIGEDGKHEVWRDGIYDHDNEPMVSISNIFASFSLHVVNIGRYDHNINV
jgi:hypothetical protein